MLEDYIGVRIQSWVFQLQKCSECVTKIDVDSVYVSSTCVLFVFVVGICPFIDDQGFINVFFFLFVDEIRRKRR